MPPRHLLYLSAQQATAFGWQNGELLEETHFATTAAGRQQFAAYLEEHGKSGFALLANVAEEGFQIESIPFLRGADRQAMIRRRLGQRFFNARLSTSYSLGHEKKRRKNERILLAALTDTPFFEPWLECIAGAGCVLSGIYSLPLLGAMLLKKTGLAQERCLLLTVQDQSIRQSYFERGELHFSRLTPLHGTDPDSLARAFSAEAGKLQQYVSGLRPGEFSTPISACILAHANARKAIEASCVDSQTLTFRIIDSENCARQLGLKTLPADTHGESLFIHLLATTPPRSQFADDLLRHDFHLRRIRSALYGLAATALLIALPVSGKLAYETRQIGQQTAALVSEARLAAQRYDAITTSVPQQPTDSATLLRVVDRYGELEREGGTPKGLYFAISRALQQATTLDLERIDWQAGTAAPSDDNETAVVRGTLKPGADARLSLSDFQRLTDALKRTPGLQVRILQHPFNSDSGQSLRGGDAALEDDTPKTFALQIVRKRET
ncbi:MAG: hypothetical protein WAZ34_10245 [Rhodocyclaceae bacterium]